MKDFKTALVTGGTRGIGFAVAKRLAELGYMVGVTGTREEPDSYHELMDFFKAFEDCIYLPGDLSRDEDRCDMVEGMLETYGKIDLLVNNAGAAPRNRTDLLDMEEDSFDHIMDINLKGTFFLTQQVAVAMADQVKAGMDPGKIISISSVSSYTVSVNRGEYCISKAGVEMVTKLFAVRLAEYGIGVYGIRPGIIATDMVAAVKDKYDKLIYDDGILPIKRWGLPDDIAKAVEAVALDLFPYSTGQMFDVDGGFHLRRL